MSLSGDNLTEFGQYTWNNTSFLFCQENLKNLLFLLYFLLLSIVFVNPFNPFVRQYQSTIDIVFICCFEVTIILGNF